MASQLCVHFRDDLMLVRSRLKVVYAVAAPFAGSEAANQATSMSSSYTLGWLGDWLSGADLSTRQCQTAYMARYNETRLYGVGRPWPIGYPKVQWMPYYSALTPGTMWNDGRHTEDYGMYLMTAIIPWPDDLSDELVSYRSQIAIGTAVASGRFSNNHWHSTASISG